MTVRWRYWATRLARTSENTVVYNLLHDIVTSLERRYRHPITLISPTTNEEHLYGFDALTQGLPRGRIHAFQFKRPKPSVSGCARFEINREQHNALLNRFPPGIARYAFCPIPSTRDFVRSRRRVLERTIFPDVHSIPAWGLKTNNTRTIRLPPQPHVPHLHGRQPCPGITDPGKYDRLPQECLIKWDAIEEVALETGALTLGKKELPVELPVEKIRGRLGRIHYVFIPFESDIDNYRTSDSQD